MLYDVLSKHRRGWKLSLTFLGNIVMSDFGSKINREEWIKWLSSSLTKRSSQKYFDVYIGIWDLNHTCAYHPLPDPVVSARNKRECDSLYTMTSGDVHIGLRARASEREN